MSESTTAYIGLGSNLGKRENYIKKAVQSLEKSEGVELLAVSDILETEPLAGSDQPKYLNAVAEIKTILTPQKLHQKTTQIEAALGRKRKEKWSPRTIDLDILLFGTDVINQPGLKIPHRQMHLRSFVLKGLSQLNGTLEHPLLRVRITELAKRLNGADFSPNPLMPRLVSIAGVIGVGKTTLANKLAELLGGKIFLEPYDTNPFMPGLYDGKQELALDCQVYFLTHRTEQLDSDALQGSKLYISDYLFDKELIYAPLTLTKQQSSVYHGIYRNMAEKVAKPALVVFLTDTVENCLNRIHKRNRPYEQKIALNFLRKLERAYQCLFADWKTCPVIRILMSQFDCQSKTEIENLANQIKYYVAC